MLVYGKPSLTYITIGYPMTLYRQNIFIYYDIATYMHYI